MQSTDISRVAMAACLCVGMISATVLAWHYDGEAVNQAFSFFTQVLTIIGGGMGVHLVVQGVAGLRSPQPPPAPQPSEDTANTPDGQANASNDMPGI